MIDGRCIGCKRVRPSSKELNEQITVHVINLNRLSIELKRALELEEEDGKRTD